MTTMTQGMVSAAQPEAVEAGADVLASGGNAVDAAVAAALVQTAVDPFMCGIAGFGCCHIYMPAGTANAGAPTHTFIDFHGRAPQAVTPGMWEHLIVGETEDGFGFVLRDHINEIGYQSITTPMTLRALDDCLTRHGTRTLASLMPPAIAYCHEGFMVRPHVSAYLNETNTKGRIAHSEHARRIPATAKIYIKPDGSLPTPGDILRNPAMGGTYERIVEAGVDDFYTGAIAQDIARDMAAHDALLTARDLADVTTRSSEPLTGTYRGHTITTNRPPGGGVMLIEMLNILEHFDLTAMGHNSAAYIATVAEAMKIATIDKDNHVGDPAFIDVPLARLTSKEHAAEAAARIKRGEKAHVARLKSGQDESRDTTHVSVVDRHGACVSLTHSLGMPSGVVTEGLGFMYNGCMGVFDPRPGRPGSLAPGKARFSAMCPTIVFKDDQPFFVVGAPGGTYITMGVLQAILNAVDFGMSAAESVAAARICVTSDVIEITNRVRRSVEAALVKDGYEVRRYPLNFAFAGVHAIRIVDGVPDGGADPGRDGMVLTV
ncbi:MAG: gamma-glutamyltransferase [Pseudomonadota bacterium]